MLYYLKKRTFEYGWCFAFALDLVPNSFSLIIIFNFFFRINVLLTNVLILVPFAPHRQKSFNHFRMEEVQQINQEMGRM